MTGAIIAFAIFIAATIVGFVVSWILLMRSEDALRSYRATLPDARAAYADDELQDDMTVVPAALRSKANG